MLILLQYSQRMHQTIKFLNILDSGQKRKTQSVSKSHQTNSTYKKNKFIYARALNFTEDKFDEYPDWLTNRQDFVNFMYDNYENKLLSIPKICQKKPRNSSQKYFLSLYLQQIEIFKKLPNVVFDLILQNIGVKYFKTNQVVHYSNNDMAFMGLIFIGSVEFTENLTKVIKQKDQIIMNQAFYRKIHPTIIAKTQTIMLTLQISLYKIIQQKLKKDIFERSNEDIKDMKKSDFFIQLHLNDRKAHAFFQMLVPQFFFEGTHICDAGQEASKFYMLFNGEVIEKNHIYIKDSNKWPLPNKRWEVRVIYNSYQNNETLKQFGFFGDEQLTNNSNMKSSYIAKTHCSIFSMSKDNFKKFLNNEDLKRLKKYRNEHININYNQFERQIRDRVKSEHNRKKIIHKAIDTSFVNRRLMEPKKACLIQKFQTQMLKNSLIDDPTALL